MNRVLPIDTDVWLRLPDGLSEDISVFPDKVDEPYVPGNNERPD